MIRDLLNPSSGYLDLREHASGAVQVAGISEASTTSSVEVGTDILAVYIVCYVSSSEKAKINQSDFYCNERG